MCPGHEVAHIACMCSSALAPHTRARPVLMVGAQGFLTCMSVVLFLMITWELVTTEFDPAELITNSSLAMTMTRRRACSALLASAASYALAAASYMLVAPRVTAKLAVVVGLVPLGYLSYLCFVVTNVGFVRLMWLPTGAVIFGVLAVYVELERRDTEAALADLREARYHFKKA